MAANKPATVQSASIAILKQAVSVIAPTPSVRITLSRLGQSALDAIPIKDATDPLSLLKNLAVTTLDAGKALGTGPDLRTNGSGRIPDSVVRAPYLDGAYATVNAPVTKSQVPAQSGVAALTQVNTTQNTILTSLRS